MYVYTKNAQTRDEWTFNLTLPRDAIKVDKTNNFIKYWIAQDANT